jgi:hypothetical protein
LDTLLLKNSDTVRLVSHTAHISQFSLQKENQTQPKDSVMSALMIFTFGMKDNFGNSSTVPLRIMVKMRDVNTEARENSGWNF